MFIGIIYPNNQITNCITGMVSETTLLLVQGNSTVSLTKCMYLTVPKIVILTISGVVSVENRVILTAFPYQSNGLFLMWS